MIAGILLIEFRIIYPRNLSQLPAFDFELRTPIL
jgi:hypothetical protein